jgi:hypothetical protein
MYKSLLKIFNTLLGSWNIFTESNELSAILVYCGYASNVTSGATQGLSWKPVTNMNPKFISGCYHKFCIEIKRSKHILIVTQ